MAEAQDALTRGVFFDVGHGSGSFSFEVMERAMQLGIVPNTISSDVHAYNIHGPVFDQATTVSKFLYLGLGLDEAVRRTTQTPAAALRFQEQIGSLREGSEADVSIFELQDVVLDHAPLAALGGLRLGGDPARPDDALVSDLQPGTDIDLQVLNR